MFTDIAAYTPVIYFAMMITPLIFPGLFFSNSDSTRNVEVDKNDVISFCKHELQMIPIFTHFENTSTIDNIYTVLDKEHYCLDMMIPFSTQRVDECISFEESVKFLCNHRADYRIESDSLGYNWIQAKVSNNEVFLGFMETIFEKLDMHPAFIYDEFHSNDTETLIQYMLQSYSNLLDNKKTVGFIHMKHFYDFIEHASDTVLPWYRYDVTHPNDVLKLRRNFENIVKDSEHDVVSEALWRVLSNHSFI